MSSVTSTDGTTIAFETEGQGPAVILVNGALGDRQLDRKFKLMTGLSERLAPHCTVVNYDRRGRVESSEAGPFAVERETEDIAALISAVGGTASLFGFSSGGALALRATAARIGVERLAMYETPFMVDRNDRMPSRDYGQRLDELVAAGDRRGAVTHFMRDAMGMPAAVVAAMRPMPAWKLMKANAHTLPYDWAALGAENMRGEPLRPEEWATVTAPTLVVYGGKSPSNLQKGSGALAEALPNSELRVLEGVGHRLKAEVLTFGRNSIRMTKRAPRSVAEIRPSPLTARQEERPTVSHATGRSKRTNSIVIASPFKNSASKRVPRPIGPSVIFSTRLAFGFHSGSRARSTPCRRQLGGPGDLDHVLDTSHAPGSGSRKCHERGSTRCR